MKNSPLLLTLALGLTLLLNGCITPSTQPIQAINTTAPTSWQLLGKIGLTYPEHRCRGNNCKNNNSQGKISWQQQQHSYRVILSDPFNRAVMTIEGNRSTLRATPTQQQPILTTPEQFMAIVTQQSNADSALAGLHPSWLQYWVTGRPVPNVRYQRSATAFTQQGYRISTQRWQQTAIGTMPSLVVVRKGAFALKIAITQWQPLARRPL